MNLFGQLLVLLALSSFTFAADAVIQSRWAETDPRLDTNPAFSF